MRVIDAGVGVMEPIFFEVILKGFHALMQTWDDAQDTQALEWFGILQKVASMLLWLDTNAISDA